MAHKHSMTQSDQSPSAASGPAAGVSTYDVIIAGAGIAGATLALALEQGGLRPLLIDKFPMADQLEPLYDGRASAIAYSSFRQWQALGLGPDLEPHAGRIDQILVTDGHHPGASRRVTTPVYLRFDAEEIAARSEGEPMGWMLENRHVRFALHAALKRQGIPVVAPDHLTDVVPDAGGVTVRLASGTELRAALLVGSEGRGSFVRDQAGIGTTGWDYAQSAVVTTVHMARPHGNTAHEFFLPDGPFAILPLTGNRANIVWTEARDKAAALQAMPEEAFLSLLARRFGEHLGEITLVSPRFHYPLSLKLADRVIAPRTVLLGDAAHGVHPIAGQGLNLGLKDVAALAETLTEALRSGEDIGSALVLDRYAQWRQFDTVTLSLGMDLFVWLFSNDNPVIRAVRGAGVAMVNQIGPARRFFMQEAGGAVGDLPRLLRGQRL